MRKGALKKKQRQLEELHLDRREALGELVLGMFVQGSWDDDIMSRGAAEVREVADELTQLTAPDTPTGPDTGEHTAEHEMPETAEHTGVHDLPDSGDAADTAEHTGEADLPAAAAATVAAKKPPEKKEARTEPAQPSPAAEAVPEAKAGKAVAKETPAEKTSAGKAPAEDAAEEKPLPSKAGAGTKPMEAPAPQQKLSELDQMAERIAAGESAAKTAAEAARASLAADARTEISAITREIESDRSKLDAALKEAAGRIESAEKRADAAEARLARESASNREAAAGWVRSPGRRDRG